MPIILQCLDEKMIFFHNGADSRKDKNVLNIHWIIWDAYDKDFLFLFHSACKKQCNSIDCRPGYQCVNLPETCSGQCVNRKFLFYVLLNHIIL